MPTLENLFSCLEKVFSSVEKKFSSVEKKFSRHGNFLGNNGVAQECLVGLMVWGGQPPRTEAEIENAGGFRFVLNGGCATFACGKPDRHARTYFWPWWRPAQKPRAHL